ncbi:hypothetical protein T07_13135 [Trichinella nelsoni]|uniref:Uncharacterized protein n=1 Tax=Trichinella nelsoni TaxID=6336 RepID=A0A0V0SA79_9BILA|nr:hypothetical protein T07_13135 [Trichinella nelsoni]
MNFYKSALSFQLDSSRHTHAQSCVMLLKLWARKRGCVVAWRLRQPKRLNVVSSPTASALEQKAELPIDCPLLVKKKERINKGYEPQDQIKLERQNKWNKKSRISQLHFVKSSALGIAKCKAGRESEHKFFSITSVAQKLTFDNHKI